MPLIDDIVNPVGSPCAVQRAIDTHPELADELIELIGRPDIGHRQLANACRKNGMDISDWMIRRHRTNDCTWCTTQGRTWG